MTDGLIERVPPDKRADKIRLKSDTRPGQTFNECRLRLERCICRQIWLQLAVFIITVELFQFLSCFF